MVNSEWPLREGETWVGMKAQVVCNYSAPKKQPPAARVAKPHEAKYLESR